MTFNSEMKMRLMMLSLIALAMYPSVRADAKQSKAPPATAASPVTASTNDEKKTEPVPGWRSRCESTARKDALTCVVEESAVLTRTGQTVVNFSVRIPNDTKTPVALIQIPVGVYLPSGVHIQIDDRSDLQLPLQTCEQRGCFAGVSLAPQFTAEMKTGKDLKISFDNLAKQKLTVPLPLNGFGPAFDKIQ